MQGPRGLATNVGNFPDLSQIFAQQSPLFSANPSGYNIPEGLGTAQLYSGPNLYPPELLPGGYTPGNVTQAGWNPAMSAANALAPTPAAQFGLPNIGPVASFFDYPGMGGGPDRGTGIGPGPMDAGRGAPIGGRGGPLELTP